MSQPQQPESLLTFPCVFPIKVMGRREDGFAQTVSEIVLRHAPDFHPETIEMRSSSQGRYLSLTVTINAKSRGSESWTIVGHGNVANYGSDKLRFLSPVPAGCRLHARSRLAAVEATPKGTRVMRETAVHVVGSDKPALLYSAILLYQPPRGRA